MTHIVGMIEGYYESLDKFMKYWDGKTYANGNARVRPRIIIPVHFGINECGKEEFLKDLKSFCDFPGKPHSDGGKVKKTISRMAALVRKMFPAIKPVIKQFEAIESNNLRETEGKKGNHFILSFFPLGEVEDEKVDGREIV